MRCPHCDMILNWSLRECPRCETDNPGFRGKEKKKKETGNKGKKDKAPSLGFTGNMVMKVFSCIANKASSGFGDGDDGWHTTKSSTGGKGIFSGDSDFRDTFQAFHGAFDNSDSGSGGFDFGTNDSNDNNFD